MPFKYDRVRICKAFRFMGFVRACWLDALTSAVRFLCVS